MNGKTFSLAMSILSTLSISPTLKTISYGATRTARFRHQVKESVKWMVWGGMTGRGVTSLHFIPQGQTVTAEYYITKILEKEASFLNRPSTTEEPVKRKLFMNKSSETFLQDGISAHTAKAVQQ